MATMELLDNDIACHLCRF